MRAVEILFACRDALRIDRGFVEIAGEAGQCIVAFDPHRFDDRLYLFEIGPKIGFGALQQLRALIGREICQAEQVDFCGHVNLRAKRECRRRPAA